MGSGCRLHISNRKDDHSRRLPWLCERPRDTPSRVHLSILRKIQFPPTMYKDAYRSTLDTVPVKNSSQVQKMMGNLVVLVHRNHMNHITLYRIKTNTGVGNAYRASQAYRMMTHCNIPIPSEYQTHGAHEWKYGEWLKNHVMGVLEMHNGDAIVEKWAVSQEEDPQHVTIALCVNNMLMVPDILCNTVSFNSDDVEKKYQVSEIHKAIQKVNNEEITCVY